MPVYLLEREMDLGISLDAFRQRNNMLVVIAGFGEIFTNGVFRQLVSTGEQPATLGFKNDVEV